MAHIKEPNGIDFIIESEPLTDEARKEISKFIRNYRNNSVPKTTRKKRMAIKRRQIKSD